jgi:hypothetical protein
MTKTAKWEALAKKHLVNRKISDLFYMGDGDVNAMGWYESGLVLVLDNGMQVIVQQDPEGNGPGSLYLAGETESVILPAI